MADKDVDGILAALEPVFDEIVVTHNGSPRALDVESLALRAEEHFGPERVVTAENLRDAIDTATALVEEAGAEGEAFSGSGHGDHRLGRHRRRGPHAVRTGSRSDRPTRRTATPPPPDPWKSFRGVMAGTLILEAIVVLLALPVVGVGRRRARRRSRWRI